MNSETQNKRPKIGGRNVGFGSGKGKKPSYIKRPKQAQEVLANLPNAEDIANIKAMIIYEDHASMVLNKPSGVASQGGSGVVGDLDFLLQAFTNPKGKKPKLVHRLDRETSGVVLAGKTLAATAFYGAEFAARRAHKTYYAIVAGKPETTEGEINFPIKRGKQNGIDVALRAEDGTGDEALTEWRLIKTNGSASLLELAPKTGRMHQLRCHLSGIGLPILGDTKYGGLLAVGAVKVPRLMLHAHVLNIAHPGGGYKNFEAPIPDDMWNLAKALGLD
ncbi:MAG: ribosomal large subunit pseudouridine synthase C [Hyphomonadaceae bacterium]|nr:MAG: ribosomal large subunit pseudouridine synthase C [Hyphomonadaceae bacterium]